MSRPLQTIQRIFRELRRRNVYKVAATYSVVGFVLIQAADVIFPALDIPSWGNSLVVVLVLFGLPVAVVLAWAFEMTPEGVRRTPEAGSEGEGAVEKGVRPSTGYKLLVGLGLVGAAAVGAWYLTGGGNQPEVSDRSVAVLPFQAGGAEERGVFADGMDEALSSRLANVLDLRVSPSRAVKAYGDTTLPMNRIARELGVSWVVSGEVLEAEDQIRVTVELVDPETRSQRWSGEYIRRLTPGNLFDLQSEIAKRIASELQAELSSEERDRMERRPTGSLEAYRHYVRGRNLLDPRTEENLRMAMAQFQGAIRRDSTYALAWAGLADAIGLHDFYAGTTLPDSVPSQEFAARRALELAPDLAEAHASLGLIQLDERAGPAALRELYRAVDLKPSYAQAHNWLSNVLLIVGRPEAAFEHASLALELSPGSGAYKDELIRAGIANRRYAEVLPLTDSRSSYELLVLAHLERWDEIGEVARRISPDSGSTTRNPYPVFALSDIAAGDTASARVRLDSLETLQRSVEDAQIHVWIGWIRLGLGQDEAALAAFEEALRSRPLERLILVVPFIRYFFPTLLESVEDHPRYRELIREANAMWGMNPDGSLPDSVSVPFEVQRDMS